MPVRGNDFDNQRWAATAALEGNEYKEGTNTLYQVYISRTTYPGRHFIHPSPGVGRHLLSVFFFFFYLQ